MVNKVIFVLIDHDIHPDWLVYLSSCIFLDCGYTWVIDGSKSLKPWKFLQGGLNGQYHSRMDFCRSWHPGFPGGIGDLHSVCLRYPPGEASAYLPVCGPG